ncbi:MAG: polysaccharide deacetylase family protein [Arcobacteraceae bacterium]|nr:polysaccharide deacetylase family protein [Arcobacteraceae bacterium]
MRYLFFIFISYLYLQANAHIFVYHRFADIKHPTTSTSIAELEKEFKYFQDHNYKVVPLERILDKLEKKESIPSNWIALTIDDAYKSFYQNALPIFKKYKYPFTLYVYVKATDKKYGDFMTWDEIKETDKYGTIGLHSYSHPRLTKISTKEIKEDTQKAFDIFQTKMGYKPITYAYPYGEYDDRVKNTLKQFNFRAIINQSTGTVTKNSDIYDIHRLALVGDVNINHKLRYKTFNATWIEPKIFPTDGVLKHIKAKVDPKIKKLKLYITGEGWRDIKVVNGIVDETVSIYLKRARTRIMLGTDVFTISNKIIIKGTKNGK